MSIAPEALGIIPARYASTRFPGKPLADIAGKSMIRRVYEQAATVMKFLSVATDDQRIYDAVMDFGGKAVMTSSLHSSGTDRCSEALGLIEREYGRQFPVVLNIQGDEPFLDPSQLELLVSCFLDPSARIATLVKPALNAIELHNPNRPKVVISQSGEALYFSRTAIPFYKGKEMPEWSACHGYYIHIGLYAFTRDTLLEITRLPQSSLELAESLEQLRWLENGYRIVVRKTTGESQGIDTPEDLAQLLNTLSD